MLKPIHEAEELDLSEGSLTTRQFVQSCVVCKGVTKVTVDVTKYSEWVAGAYVQDVFPNTTPGQREILISGTHDDCYDYLFPPEEDFNEEAKEKYAVPKTEERANGLSQLGESRLD